MTTENHTKRRRVAPTAKDRFYTGVSLDQEVVRYVDELAGRMGLDRSYVINTIVYEYAKLIEKQNLRPLADLTAIRM
jgi:metal-responsive CopG/Arc/MetJ family transcriptional regulator